MNLLAIDTSSVACSVALQFRGENSYRHEEHPREHTRLLVPMISDLLSGAGASIAELDAIVLGNGPGSFIGMRIGTAVAQGLAHAGGIRIVPVSSLAAVALQAAGEGDFVAVAQDAHMNEVYLGLYDVRGGEVPVPLTRERLQAEAPIDELDGKRGCVAAGAGWQRYPALLGMNRDRLNVADPVLYPDARAVLSLGAAEFETAASAPEAVVPTYLRQKVAQKPGSPEP